MQILSLLAAFYISTLSYSRAYDVIYKHYSQDDVIYLEDHCNPPIYSLLRKTTVHMIHHSIIVKLSNNTSTVHQVVPEYCNVTFRAADESNHLLLHFESVMIDFGNSTPDRLHVYEGYAEQDNRLTPSNGIYGMYNTIQQYSGGGIVDYKSRSSTLTLQFQGTVSRKFDGFTVTITEMSDKVLNSCPGNMSMECLRGCIYPSLQCNSYNNCGEGDSDEEGCEPSVGGGYKSSRDYNSLNSSADLGLMIGCAVSIIILMVVVMWLGVVCLRRTRQQAMQRRYQRQFSGPDGVEGAVVEPSPIQNVMIPPQYFPDPPPPYNESYRTPLTVNLPSLSGHANDSTRQRSMIMQGDAVDSTLPTDLPPPYSAVNENDEARLLVNEQLVLDLSDRRDAVSDRQGTAERDTSSRNVDDSTPALVAATDIDVPASSTSTAVSATHHDGMKHELLVEEKDDLLLDAVQEEQDEDESKKSHDISDVPVLDDGALSTTLNMTDVAKSDSECEPVCVEPRDDTASQC